MILATLALLTATPGEYQFADRLVSARRDDQRQPGPAARDRYLRRLGVSLVDNNGPQAIRKAAERYLARRAGRAN